MLMQCEIDMKNPLDDFSRSQTADADVGAVTLLSGFGASLHIRLYSSYTTYLTGQFNVIYINLSRKIYMIKQS